MKVKLIEPISLADIIKKAKENTDLPFDEIFVELEEYSDLYIGGEKDSTFIVMYTEEK